MNRTIAVWGRGIVCALTVALAGCNFDASGSSDATTPVAQKPPPPPPADPTQPDVPNPPGGTNTAPQIAGAPGNEALVGGSYSFRPNATDADGDSLTFSVAGKPAWASFNSSTGRLYGTPTIADLGSYEGIVISVSDGSVIRQLPQFEIDVVDGTDGSVVLAWEPPTQNTDGTALTNLRGYRIHYGTQAGSYDQVIDVNNAGVTSYVVDNLVPGTYFFAVSAISSTGAESEPSAEATKTI
jgi:hypothetical protein